MEASLKEHGFELKQQIGKGSYGTCYVVFSYKYKQEFVLKVITIPDDGRADAVILSFNHETEALSHVGHPNIVRVYQYWVDGRSMFILLEYCRNGSLLDKIKTNGAMGNMEMREYTRQIIAAFQAIHKAGYAHHDIKPANILIDQFNRLKIADFGLAALCDTGRATSFGGSMQFMSPETLMRIPYDALKADIWSIGTTLYQMAHGRLPWTDSSPKALLKQMNLGFECTESLSLDLVNIIERCLVIDPERRASIDELYSLLSPPELKAQKTRSAAIQGVSILHASHSMRKNTLQMSAKLTTFQPRSIRNTLSSGLNKPGRQILFV